MFCTECGTENKEQFSFCRHCGLPLAKSESKPAPRPEPRPAAVKTPSDSLPPYEPGSYLQSAYYSPESRPPPVPQYGQPPVSYPSNMAAMPGYDQCKSKVGAGILALLFGYLGVHRFYLGYNGIGIAQLVLTVLGLFTCGITTLAACVWAIVDAILIFTDTLDRDAAGNPLRN